MIVIAGSVKILESKRDTALAAAADMARTSRDEEGCIDYRFSVEVDDPLIVRLFEAWEDADALGAHFATEHFASFGEVVAAFVASEPEFTRYEVASHGPLFG